MNPNNFKKGDKFTSGAGTYEYTVSYISGQYVYYNDCGLQYTKHYKECTLVGGNKFAPGDYVRHSTEPTGVGTVLDKECGVHGYYSVKFDSWYGECRDKASNLILVSRAGAIDELLKAGKYIEAIKEHRTIHGTGLKESKDAIDALSHKAETPKADKFASEGQTPGDILSKALAPKHKFKVGDKVTSEGYEDDVGTVLAARDGKYAVHYKSQTSVTASQIVDHFIWREDELTAHVPKWPFKVGDIIKGKYSDEQHLVGDVRPSDGFFYVKKYPCAGYNDPKYYELVTKVAIVPTIVVRHDVGNGYRPNDKPRVHNSVAEATAEAVRLAKANPGVKFDTFTLATSSVATKPVEPIVTTTVA